MIKAIIFDCFGVLTSDAWLPFKKQNFGDDPSKFEEAGRLNALCDSGKISYNQFITQVGELAGVSSSEVDVAISKNVSDEKLFDYIDDSLKPHYKLAILSNAGANWLEELFSAEQIALFDSILLSCDTGFIKPQVEAYESALQALGVSDPKECIFIDDQARYCEAAEKFGLKTIRYRSREQAIQEIDQLLNADSDS